jgi:hypothetical protein
LFFWLMPCAASIAGADGVAGSAAKQSVAVFSNVDGQTIVVGVGGTTQPLATLGVSRHEIKLGSTGVGWTKTLAGTLRYAASRLQFCDGVGWRKVGLDRNE